MIIDSPQKMMDLGNQISKKHSKILLYGELGAGKTHFTKGFASGLAINPDIVQSPTYTYINIYDKKILHIDLYRLDNIDDFISKGILDMINDFEYIIIERPKRENLYYTDQWLAIEIDKLSEGSRKIEIIKDIYSET